MEDNLLYFKIYDIFIGSVIDSRLYIFLKRNNKHKWKVNQKLILDNRHRHKTWEVAGEKEDSSWLY